MPMANNISHQWSPTSFDMYAQYVVPTYLGRDCLRAARYAREFIQTCTYRDRPPSSKLKWPRLRLPIGSTRSVGGPDGIGNSSPLESAVWRCGLDRLEDSGGPLRALLSCCKCCATAGFTVPFSANTFFSASASARGLPPMRSIIDMSLSSRASMACGLSL